MSYFPSPYWGNTKPMRYHNWQNSGVHFGSAQNQSHLRPFKETPSPWAAGSKADKLAYCQRQIDRLVRWAKEEPDNEVFIKAGAEWLDKKTAVLSGRL